MYRPLEFRPDYPNNALDIVSYASLFRFGIVKSSEASYQIMEKESGEIDGLFRNYRNEIHAHGMNIDTDGSVIWTPKETEWVGLPLSTVRFTQNSCELLLSSPLIDEVRWSLISPADSLLNREIAHLGCISVHLEPSYGEAMRKQRFERKPELQEQAEGMAKLLAARRAEMSNLGFVEDKHGYVKWHNFSWLRRIQNSPEEYKTFCDWQIEQLWQTFQSKSHREPFEAEVTYAKKMREYMVSSFRALRYVPCDSDCVCDTCKKFRTRILEKHSREFGSLQAMIDIQTKHADARFDTYRRTFHTGQKAVRRRFDNAMRSKFDAYYAINERDGVIPKLTTYDLEE